MANKMLKIIDEDLNNRPHVSQIKNLKNDLEAITRINTLPSYLRYYKNKKEELVSPKFDVETCFNTNGNLGLLDCYYPIIYYTVYDLDNVKKEMMKNNTTFVTYKKTYVKINDNLLLLTNENFVVYKNQLNNIYNGVLNCYVEDREFSNAITKEEELMLLNNSLNIYHSKCIGKDKKIEQLIYGRKTDIDEKSFEDYQAHVDWLDNRKIENGKIYSLTEQEKNYKKYIKTKKK